MYATGMMSTVLSMLFTLLLSWGGAIVGVLLSYVVTLVTGKVVLSFAEFLAELFRAVEQLQGVLADYPICTIPLFCLLLSHLLSALYQQRSYSAIAPGFVQLFIVTFFAHAIPVFPEGYGWLFVPYYIGLVIFAIAWTGEISDENSQTSASNARRSKPAQWKTQMMDFFAERGVDIDPADLDDLESGLLNG